MRLHFSLLSALLVASQLFACGDDDGMSMVDEDFGAGDMAADDMALDGMEPDMELMCPEGPPMPEPFDCSMATAIEAGDAITAEANTWTWVPFPETRCMNGTPFGIGVNLNPDSDRLMIFFEGGGACFDRTTCLTAVANLNGYDETKFDRDAAGRLVGLPFDRTDADNPVADFNFVYVPYCSGDVFAGANEMGSVTGQVHVGSENVAAILRRVVPTFDGVSDVLLTGSSAGGLGALMNYEQVQNAFGCTPVNMLNDAGAVLTDEFLAPCQQTTLREQWSPPFPEGCPQCECQEDGGGIVNIYAYLSERYPDRRFAYVTAVSDNVFRTFYSWGLSPMCDRGDVDAYSEEMFADGVDALRGFLAPYENVRTFYVPGTVHTFLGNLTETEAGGVNLADYVADFLDPDADFVDVGP
ncbi:MAG: pectin acetylesterase-family hydrolase [Myxococcota bacterium]